MSTASTYDSIYREAITRLRNEGVSQTSREWQARFRRMHKQIFNERAPEESDEGKEALRRTRARGIDERDRGFRVAYESAVAEVRDERAAKSRTTTTAAIAAFDRKPPAVVQKVASPPTAAPRPPQPPKATVPFVVAQTKAAAPVRHPAAVTPATRLEAALIGLVGDVHQRRDSSASMAKISALKGSAIYLDAQVIAGIDRARMGRDIDKLLKVLNATRKFNVKAAERAAA